MALNADAKATNNDPFKSIEIKTINTLSLLLHPIPKTAAPFPKNINKNFELCMLQ
jgi:hypothetical protein